MKIVKCTKCEDIVFKAKVNLKVGMELNQDVIESMQGHVVGDKLNCKKCGNEVNIYKEDNWIDG